MSIRTIIFLFLLAGGIISCKDENAAFKKDYMKTCEQLAGAQVADSRIVPLVHDYCECAAEQLAKKMPQQELDEMKDLDSNPALREKILEISSPCLKEFNQKSAALVR